MANYISKPQYSPTGFYFLQKQNPDGTVGIDYFDPGGRAITNAEFATNTGADTTQLEHGSVDNPFANTGSNLALGAFQGSSGTLGTGTGTGTGNENMKFYNGHSYDLSDPTQQAAYLQAIQQNLGAQRDQLLQQAQQAFQNNDQQSVQQYQQSLSALDQNLSDIQGAAAQFATQYGTTVAGFNEGKGQGDVNRQNYFSNISPNAFQSSQSSSQVYANDKYQQGLGDLTNQLNQTVGLDYYNAFDPTTGTSTASFDPSSQYGRQAGAIGDQRGGLENQFNTYRTNAQTNYQNQQSQIGNQYNQGVQDAADSLGQFDVNAGYNPAKYGVTNITPYQAPAFDLNAYTPYTNFASLSNPGGQGSQYKAPMGPSNNAFRQDQIDSYLGRTNTTLPGGTTSTNWANKYLNGKLTT